MGVTSIIPTGQYSNTNNTKYGSGNTNTNNNPVNTTGHSLAECINDDDNISIVCNCITMLFIMNAQ